MPAKERQPVRPRTQWLTTWRRLLCESTFDNLDELQAFLEELGLHNGDIPTKEAFRRGLAKSHRHKFYWNLTKCTRLLRSHAKCADA